VGRRRRGERYKQLHIHAHSYAQMHIHKHMQVMVTTSRLPGGGRAKDEIGEGRREGARAAYSH